MRKLSCASDHRRRWLSIVRRRPIAVIYGLPATSAGMVRAMFGLRGAGIVHPIPGRIGLRTGGYTTAITGNSRKGTGDRFQLTRKGERGMSSLSFPFVDPVRLRTSQPRSGGRTQPSRECLAIDYKAGFVGKLVVQFHSGFVAFVGQPVDATGGGGAGL